MPDLRTEVTEIATALGMTGLSSIDEALRARPAVVRNVSEIQWERLSAARSAGEHLAELRAAWENGRAFLMSGDGLRGRTPAVIEWKGAHQPPGFELIPADLRVDHVYLISCKYQSQILTNSSPANLFDRRLSDRTAARDTNSWYNVCAPVAYDNFYQHVRAHIGQHLLPADTNRLDAQHLDLIRQMCARRWPAALTPHWESFSFDVASASAARWTMQLTTVARQEEMLWRLLRLSPAPYFVLGVSSTGTQTRLRIGTPWDWRQAFRMRSFAITPSAAGQPRVDWSAIAERRDNGVALRVDGHVEVRWAHGRFSSVEAKIYLDTPHRAVAGYFPLAGPPGP